MWPPFAVRPACTSPTVDAGEELTGGTFFGVHLAWNGTEGLAAYVRQLTSWQVELQRFDAQGRRVGSSGNIASMLAMPPRATVAADPSRYLVCWQPGTTISCAVVPAGTGNATNGATGMMATLPSLAWRDGVFALAAVTTGGTNIYRMRVDGTVATLDQTLISASQTTDVKLVARRSGWAVSVTKPGQATMLHLLTPQLLEDGSPLVISAGTVIPALSAWNDDVVAIFSESSQVSVVVLDTVSRTVSTKVKVDRMNATSTYGKVAAAGGLNGFATAWSAFEGYTGYRAVSAAGAALGADALSAWNNSWDDNATAMTAVSDGFVFATSISPSASSVQLVHLGCP